MTDLIETIARIKTLMESASRGPWHTVEPPWLGRGKETYVIAGSNDPNAAQTVCVPPDDFESPDEAADRARWAADAELIATLRNAAPALIAEIEAMSRLVAVVLDQEALSEGQVVAILGAKGDRVRVRAMQDMGRESIAREPIQRNWAKRINAEAKGE